MDAVDCKPGCQDVVGGSVGVCHTFRGERSVLPTGHATSEIGMARTVPEEDERGCSLVTRSDLVSTVI